MSEGLRVVSFPQKEEHQTKEIVVLLDEVREAVTSGELKPNRALVLLIRDLDDETIVTRYAASLNTIEMFNILNIEAHAAFMRMTGR